MKFWVAAPGCVRNVASSVWKLEGGGAGGTKRDVPFHALAALLCPLLGLVHCRQAAHRRQAH